ncbi:MAG: FAD-binding domain-containing protein [Granulosicoccus sp.]
MNLPAFEHFLCNPEQLQTRIAQIDPRAYDKTRNYLDGEVTWLSPFVTHGVISTQSIANTVLAQHEAKACYRLLFELGWREFFHRTWQLNGENIFRDIRHPQTQVLSSEVSKAIVNSSTGIQVIDECLDALTTHGVMHNHARMWIASLSCNIAGTHWQEPARWLHYHLLDGDLASNTLSWQWIAGTFSHKKYLANQNNIDKYSNSEQRNSWLDISYEDFEQFTPPEHLLVRCKVDYCHEIPTGMPIRPLKGAVALRSLWQLDPEWQKNIDQHIIFVDTDLNHRWPMSPLRWRFIEHWAKYCNAPIFYGTIDQLQKACADAKVIRAEYPACEHWPGVECERDWLYPLPDNPFNSFSQYFKQVKHHVGL